MVILFVHNFMLDRLKVYGKYICWKSMHTLQAFADIQIHLFTTCRRWITWHCFPIVIDIKCDARRPCTSDSVAYFVYTITQNKTHLQYKSTNLQTKYKSTNLQTKVLSPSFVFWTNNILFEQPLTDVLRMSHAGHLDMNIHCTCNRYECWGVILISHRSLRLLGESSQLSWGFGTKLVPEESCPRTAFMIHISFFFSCQSLQTFV